MHYTIKIFIRKSFSENFINIWFCVFARLRTTVIEKRCNSYIKSIVVKF